LIDGISQFMKEVMTGNELESLKRIPVCVLYRILIMAIIASILSSSFLVEFIPTRCCSKGIKLSLPRRLMKNDELSPYYHEDRRERDMKYFSPIHDPIGLAKLLQQRYGTYKQCKNETLNKSNRNNNDCIRLGHIDQQLQEQYDIVIYNHPPIWSRLGKHSPPNGVRIQQVQKELRAMQRLYGPTGHPYQHVGHLDSDDLFNNDYDCDITISEIHSLLSQYTMYKLKMNRETNTEQQQIQHREMADGISFELNIHGVRVSDSTLQWTTHPTYDITQVQQVPCIVAINQTHLSQAPYQRDRMSLDFTDRRQQQQIEQLLNERYEAYQREEYDTASWILYELHCTYNVGINDSTHTWSLGCQFTDCTNTTWTPPQPSPLLPKDLNQTNNNINQFTLPILVHDETNILKSATQYRQYVPNGYNNSIVVQNDQYHDRIRTLIQNRIQKREEGKFLEADTIRNILWHTYVRMYCWFYVLNYNCVLIK
jgi:hypothetical protein